MLPACGSPEESSGDAKEIYGAVLTYLVENRFGTDGEPEKPEMLVIRPASYVYQRDAKAWARNWAYVRGETERPPYTRLTGLRDDTCVNFVGANGTSHDLSKLLEAPLPIVLLRSEDTVGWAEMKAVAHERPYEPSGFWRQFHIRYPRAYALISLSRPGRSDDGTQVLVYVSMSRGSLAAWGGYCLLNRVGDQWQVQGISVTVVS